MLPVPFFAFQMIYERLARQDWDAVGALPPFELANEHLILSALGQPLATAGGMDAYPTVPAKAAVLFRGLVKNHGLRDGNKRLAVTVMTIFLLQNGWLPGYTNSQLYLYARRVAAHRGNYSLTAIERWIRRNSILLPDEDLAVVREQNLRLRAEIPDMLAAVVEPVMLDPAAWPQAQPG